MAIAFNAATDGGNNGGTTGSLTFSHTRASSATGLVVVPFVGDVAGGADDILGVAFDGVSLSLLAKRITGAGPASRLLYCYYGLFSGNSGAHNVVITASSNHYLIAGAADYTGVKQTGQPDASGTAAGSGSINHLDGSIVTVADNSWVLVAESGGGGGPPTATVGLTRRALDGTFNCWGFFDSNGPKSPAGTFNFTTNRASVGDSNTILHVIGSFQPDTGGGSPTARRSLTTLGVA